MKQLLLLAVISLLSTRIYSQNLVRNSSFKNENYWRLSVDKHLNGGDELDAKINYTDRSGHDDQNCMKVRISSPHPEKRSLRVSLDQKILGLKKNKKYKLTLWVKSSMSIEDHIAFQLSSNTNRKHAKYVSGKLRYEGDNQWHRVTKIFETTNKGANKVDLDNVYLQFGFAHRKGTFYVDDIKLERIK